MAANHKGDESPAGSAHFLDALSRELNIPFDDVQTLYRGEFERLTATARIHQFVSLLAAKNTRDVLRGHD